MKVPTKSMVKKEAKEVKVEKVEKEVKVEMEEEELVESFKKLRMTNTSYVILFKNKGDTVEVSPVKKKPAKLPITSKKTPPMSSPMKPQIKGIDSMTVEEFKAAIKKRRLKGLTRMKKEQLVEKLKKEIKMQRTMGGGGLKVKARMGEVKEERRVEEVQGEDVRHRGSEGNQGGGEGEEDWGRRSRE